MQAGDLSSSDSEFTPMRSDPVKHSRRKQHLFWQGLLILLPMGVLAAIGLGSLAQDRALARSELQQRAEQLANDFARELERQFHPYGNRGAFLHTNTLADPDGVRRTNVVWGKSYPVTNLFTISLVKPAPPRPGFPWLPKAAPLPIDQLGSAERAAWEHFERQLTPPSSFPELEAALDDLLQFGFPARFEALAKYSFATLALRGGEPASGLPHLEDLLGRSPHLLSESGLPLLQSVHLQLLRHWPFELVMGEWTNAPHAFDFHPWLDEALFSNPSPLSSVLAAEADERGIPARRSHLPGSPAPPFFPPRESYAALWQNRLQRIRLENETRAFLHGTEHEHDEWPRAFYLMFDQAEYLVLRTENLVMNEESPETEPDRDRPATQASARDVHQFWFIPVAEFHKFIQPAMNAFAPIPAYLGVAVEVAGRVLHPLSGDVETRLATSLPPPHGTPLAVDVFLTDPALFYARQRQRAWSFGALIAVAALAGLIGWAATWRALNRQYQLNAMQSNFVSSVSHELRAPLASVRLMAEGLDRGTIHTPDKQREYFRFIVRECGRLSSLVENVLDFSRIEQGHKQYEFEATDVSALVAHTVKLMEPCAADRRVTLEPVAPPESVCAEIDGKAIQQALVNLIDNAIKHSPPDTPVKIVLESNPPGAPGCISIQVEDFGKGIPIEEHEKIFDLFYRSGSELRRETPGVGIGLSIVKHIVESHGGRVRVQSVPGQGSRFEIILPEEQQ
jgi:signal transduction histidine kinase